MPRRILKSKRKEQKFDINRLNDAQLFYLMEGMLLFHDTNELGFAETEITIFKKLWKKHNKIVMDKWASTPNRNAGERPWAWWEFDAKEPLRKVGAKTIQIPEFRKSYDVFEPVLVYLIRLNLPQAWEVEELKKRYLDRSLHRYYLHRYEYETLKEFGVNVCDILGNFLLERGVIDAKEEN